MAVHDPPRGEGPRGKREDDRRTPKRRPPAFGGDAGAAWDVASGVALLGLAPLAALYLHHRVVVDLRAAPPVWTWTAVLVATALAGGVWAWARAVRARRTLDRSRKVERILDALAEGVVVADRDGRMLTANASARRILGAPPEDHDTLRWLADARVLEPEGEAPNVGGARALRRALAGEATPETTGVRRGAGAADPMWVAVSSRPLAGDDGDPGGAVLVLRDVSARYRATEERERLSRAVEQTADLVVITDRLGTMQYVNPAFEATTGYAAAEAVGKNPRILKSGRQPPEFYRTLWDTILRGDVYHGTLINRRKDGTTYPAEQTITPMKDTKGRVTHFVAVSKDMTEHDRLRRREVELELAATVQRRLYPRGCAAVAGLDAAGRCAPASETSGDMFDVLERPGGALALAVGDVSGHGLGAALLMAETRAYVRSLVALPLAPDEILRRVHALLAPDLAADAFVTLLLAEVDPRSRAIRWANAGHVPGLLLGPAGCVVARLEPTGPAIGVDDAPTYGRRDGATLEDGRVLLLATDGATECPRADGTLLEEEGLVALAAEDLSASAADLVGRLTRRIVEVSSGASGRDDVTLVAVRASPGPRPSA
jgi:PAS domain S-box-containing protein